MRRPLGATLALAIGVAVAAAAQPARAIDEPLAPSTVAASGPAATPGAPASGEPVPPGAPVPPASPRYTDEPLDWSRAAIDVTLKLLAVLVLAYGALVLLRRYSLGSGLGRRAGALEVLESVALGPNRAIYLIRVGDRRLVLGVTATQITPLAVWEADASPALPPALDGGLASAPTTAPEAVRPRRSEHGQTP
jgi:flagellar biosynthetic protein FliO